MSEAVIDAVAEREGVSVSELRKPLYDVVDPEALDALFRNGGGEVTFRYLDYVVTVTAEGKVELEPVD